MGFWFVAKKVIGEADIVLFLVDARFPEISKNREVSELLERHRKTYFLVFNKTDLVSKEGLEELKSKNEGAFFVSVLKGTGVSELRTALKIEGKRITKGSAKVGVVGYPNVGKSALINALSYRARTSVSPVAGTTKGMQFVKAGNLKIIDSPGVITLEDKENKLGFIGAKNPEHLRNPESSAAEIVFYLLGRNKTALEEYAGAEIKSIEPYEALKEVGIAKKMLVKGGKVDERRIAIQLIRDWQKGRIKV